MRASATRLLLFFTALGLAAGCTSGGGWPGWKLGSRKTPFSDMAGGSPASTSSGLPSAAAPGSSNPAYSGAPASPYSEGAFGDQADAAANDNSLAGYPAADGASALGGPTGGVRAQRGAYDPNFGSSALAHSTPSADAVTTNPYATAGYPETAAAQAAQASGQETLRTAGARYDSSRYGTGSRYDAGVVYPSDTGQEQRYGPPAGNRYASDTSDPGVATSANPDYRPGQSDYRPGTTGYSPPGVPAYQSPAGNYSVPYGETDPRYRPGSTRDYVPTANATQPAVVDASLEGATTSRYGGSASPEAIRPAGDDRYGPNMNGRYTNPYLPDSSAAGSDADIDVPLPTR